MAGGFERSQDEAGGQDQNDGLSPIDLLNIPEGLASVVNRIIRRNGMRLEDIAKDMGKPRVEARKLLDELAVRGYVRQVEINSEIWYKAQFGRKADKALSQTIWSALDQVADEEEQHPDQLD